MNLFVSQRSRLLFVLSLLCIGTPASATMEWVGDVVGVPPGPGGMGSDLEIGALGSGEVSINPTGGTLPGGGSAPGSDFTYTGSRFLIGGEPLGFTAAQGTLTVSGAGQSLTVAPASGGLAGIGWSGTGTLDVDAGAAVLLDMSAVGVGADPRQVGGGVGVEPSAQGFVNVTNGSTVTIRGQEVDPTLVDNVGLDIGNMGTGTMMVSGGSTFAIESSDADIGGVLLGHNPFSSGSLTVTGTGSSLTMAGDATVLEVGRGGTGSFELLNGATAGSKVISIGSDASGSGTFTVGAGSTYTVSGAIPAQGLVFPTGQGAGVQIAESGSGTATVHGSLVLDASAGGPSPGLSLGTSATGNGALLVDGATAGLQVIGAGTGVGVQGSGSLEVTRGAWASLDGLAVGLAASSAGTVLVDGTGSVLDAGPGTAIALVPDTNLPSGGSAQVTVSNGGTLVSPVTGVGAGGTLAGDGTVQGTVLNLGGSVSPGLSSGTLTIDGDFTMTEGLILMEVDGSQPGEFDVLEVLGSASFLGGELRFLVDPSVDLSAGLDLDVLSTPDLAVFAGVVSAFQGGAPIDVGVTTTGGGLRATLVPEPGSRLLLGCAVASLALLRRLAVGQQEQPCDRKV